MRHSSVGAEDSDKRQRAAIAAYAKAAGVEIVETYYDKAISGERRILSRVPRAAQATVWPVRRCKNPRTLRTAKA